MVMVVFKFLMKTKGHNRRREIYEYIFSQQRLFLTVIFQTRMYLGLFCFVLQLHLQHMEVPRLGAKSELQLPAYTTATAMQDL